MADRGNDYYLTIKNISEGSYKDRGSKFLAFAYPVKDENEIHETLEKVKKKYRDARHYCYAWVLGSRQTISRVSDDGEPANSAGKPILAQILSFKLTNVLVVVVRYFGGTLLGVGGLIQAYKTASHEALKTANIVKEYLFDVYLLKFNYSQMNEVMKMVKSMELDFYDHIFNQNCEMKLKVPLGKTREFISQIARNISINSELILKG